MIIGFSFNLLHTHTEFNPHKGSIISLNGNVNCHDTFVNLFELVKHGRRQILVVISAEHFTRQFGAVVRPSCEGRNPLDRIRVPFATPDCILLSLGLSKSAKNMARVCSLTLSIPQLFFLSPAD
jgi:hypothetical protein